MAFLKDDDCLLVGRDKKDYRISVKDFAEEVGGGGGSDFSGNYNDLTNKPTEFPPETHGHAWGEITGKPCLYECNTYIQSLTVLP